MKRLSVALLLPFMSLTTSLAFAECETQHTLYMDGDHTQTKDNDTILIAAGNAKAHIDGQDARVDADEITYNKETRIVETAGNVRITRHNTLTTGSRFRFKVDSMHYLVTESGVRVNTTPRDFPASLSTSSMNEFRQFVADHQRWFRGHLPDNNCSLDDARGVLGDFGIQNAKIR